MAIILTPDMIMRASHRFTAKKLMSEQDEPSLSRHIQHFYEDFEMPIIELFELIDAAKAGELEAVEEKLDGQNITFTVRDGRLLFFSKGGGGQGKDRSDVMSHPVESVRNAFIKAYDAIEEVAIPPDDPSRWQDLFQNGSVMIESAVLTPENPNTIVYDEPAIRFIQTSQTSPSINSLFSDFKSVANATVNEEFYMGPVPYLNLKSSLDATDQEAEDIKKGLSQLISSYGVSTNGTVGNLIHAMVRRQLAQSGLVPDSLLDLAATRVATGKGPVGRVFPKTAGKDAWKTFQRDILSNRASYLAESIIPLERIIQRVGSLAFRNLEFTLAAGNRDDLIQQIADTRRAFEGGHILASPKQLEGIRVALDRIGSEGVSNRFSMATEGIVFQWKGKTRKLTGLFTPINKLRGFFAYGENRATIQEPIESGELQEAIRKNLNKLLFEGGNAFKDAEGNIVTRQDRIPRADVEPIVSNFVKDILEPLGMDHVGVGTTVTDTPDVGDVDVVVSADNARSLHSKLSSHPELQSELSEAPGVERLYTLPGGTGIAVLYKVPISGDLVQVDVMPSKGVNLDHVSWMLAGAGAGGVKSRYRNILLAWIAKNKSEKESSETGQNIKYTYARGLLKKIDGVAEMAGRVTDPDIFLPMLGINASKDEVRSFEGLVNEMRKDHFLNSILQGYREYLNNRNHLTSQDPKRRSDAEAAVSYIEGGSVEEAFRELIRQLLTEGGSSLDSLVGADTSSGGRVSMGGSGHSLGEPKLFVSDDPTGKVEPINHKWLSENSVDDPLYTGGPGSVGKLLSKGYDGMALGIATSSQQNDGERFEDGMVGYAKSLGITLVRLGKPGADLELKEEGGLGRTYELKKSEGNTPNLMLNASFPKGAPNHYYVFVINLPKFSGSGGVQKAWDEIIADAGGKDPKAIQKAFDKMEQSVDRRRQIEKELSYFLDNAQARVSVDTYMPTSDLGPRTTSTQDAEGVKDELNTDVQRFLDLKKEVEELEGEEVAALFFASSGRVTKDSLKAVKKHMKQEYYSEPRAGSPKPAGRIGSQFKKILGDVRLWIVPSLTIRLAILKSAFPSGAGNIYDPETGHVDPQGSEQIAVALKTKLDKIGIEKKIADKIAPVAAEQMEKGSIKPKDVPGFTFGLGLLQVRVSLKIEPPTAVGGPKIRD